MTDYLYSIVAGLALALCFLLLQPSAPVVAPVVLSEREQWAVALLAAVGNAQPTREIIQEVVNWSYSEDGCEHNCTENGAPRLSALERNNLWNTTKPGFNEDGCNMADCVRHYATMADGIAANAATLAQENFSEVRAALLANDPEGFKHALWASGWAASHYGYGVEWVEETQARVSLPKCLPTSTGQISAHFSDTSSPYWAGQAGGMHNGTDYSGNQGDPVFAPFAFRVEAIEYYGDAGRIGWYVQGRFQDGYLFYAGHLGTVAVQVGDQVEACQPIGTIGEVNHTHIKINRPGSPEPCEATGCDDFERYFEEH